MAVAEVSGLPLLFCVRCGAWSTGRPQKLAELCTKRRSPAGTAALAAIEAGWTPEGPALKRRLTSIQHLQAPGRDEGGAECGPVGGVVPSPEIATARLAALRARVRAREAAARADVS